MMSPDPGDAREVALSVALELHHQHYSGDEDDTAAVIRTASMIFGWLTGSAAGLIVTSARRAGAEVYR